MPAFRINFRELRDARRRAEGRRQLPIVEISDKTGLSRATLARYERGEQLDALDATAVVALMRYFGVSFDELVTLQENGKR